ncbi:hypothetical protein E2C01_006687 [Portunus trituberculatus]|uniref:Chromo domain-containing protein n=1 Tax=Portunus trituberculatus TaxID=210409 RepID=A0A5B7CVS3_PORTR|nr:hypothetical protein [Portunus trituberculatus]
MNSCVSVDAEDGVSGEEGTSDPPKDPSPRPETQGNVVLVLPPKESDDCLPLMVNGVPVYISQTASGSPLYIRHQAPTVEEMLRHSEDVIANFDGFSDASGQTFEGFSEGSCSSVLFEGFSEDAGELPTFSIFHNSDSFSTDDDSSSLSESMPSRRKSGSARRPSARSKKLVRESTVSLQRKIKKEREDKPKRSKTTQSSTPAASKRRQSTDKKEKESLDCIGLELSKKPRHLPTQDDPNYIGEQCNDIGCTVSFLERMAIREVKLCNGVVRELSDFANQIQWDKEYVVRWIQRLSGVRTEEPVENCDLRSIQAVLKRRKALAIIHSGNQHLKMKLKSFDDTVFVLPSIARRKGAAPGLTPAAGQSTDDETCSESEPAVDMKPAEVIEESDQDMRKEGGEEEVKARRGVKRATQDSENKRQIKGRRTSKEINQNKEEEESIPHKTEKEGVSEGEHQHTQVKTEGKTSGRDTGVVNNQVKEKNEGQQTPADPTRTPQRRIGTRRASILAAKETETQGTDKGRRHRRPSTTLEEEKHKDDKPKSQKDKDNMKEHSDEQKSVVRAKVESPARLRTSTRRGSLALTRQEQTNAEVVGETKEETGKAIKTNKTEVEDKQDHNHKAKEEHEVSKEQKKQSESENLKSTRKEIQGGKIERRIGTRRASMLALQEERMEKEVGTEKQTRRGSKQEEEEVINEVKGADSDKWEIGKETPRNRRTTRRESMITKQEEIGRIRSRRISLAKMKQEMENQIIPDTKKEMEETDKDDKEQKQAMEKIGKFRKGIVTPRKRKAEDEDDSEDKTEETDEDTQTDNDNKEMKSKAKSDVEGEMNKEEEEEDKPTSEQKEKQDTENKLNESLDSDDNQVILKRNKVINKDKRISRWQNKKMRKVEEQTSPRKEETDSEYSQLEQTTYDDMSDDSDGNLMIDEGDEALSDLGEGTLTGEGDSSLKVEQCEPAFTTPRKKKTLDNEKEEQMKTNKMEGSTEKEVSEGELDANQGTRSKETSPQDTTEPLQRPQGMASSYNGTLGVSKSGRLRKPSTKGMQSIEIKCLFMQRDSETPRPPPPLPVLKEDRKDKDWIREKRSPVKCEKRERDSGEGRPSPVKYERKDKEQVQEKWPTVNSDLKEKECSPPDCKPRKPLSRTKKPSTEFTTYTYKDGHLVPRFKETDCYLGKYCAQAGLTVDDLNADGRKDVRMTFGMIKELHDFYTSRKATKTSLAIRLFKMNGREILDNTHLLSTVIRLTSVAAIRHTDTQRLEKEFLLPVRIGYSPNGKEMKSPVQIKRERTTPQQEFSPKRVRKTVKKRGAKPEDSGDEECYNYADEATDDELVSEILLTCGSKGNITRGDIVHLYTTWLRNKMSLGSNTFVTDLLHSVEKLMAERCIAPLRIPAGTLMSSSVKLYDEYRQILKISKEDAVMYLQEDWLEDIKYLLSISAPSRRSTTEAEGALATTTEESDASTAERSVRSEAVRRCSEGSKKEVVTFEVKKSKPLKKNKERTSLEMPRSHQMESVGKRKRKSVRKSLDEYERDILHEIEKVGMLEEDEEDMLSQLHRDEMKSDFVEDWEERDKRRKNNEEENERIANRDVKEISSPRKEKRPTKEGDLDIEKIVDFQEIHDSRGKKHMRYLVRWAGRDSVEDSWLGESNMAASLIDAFWKKKKKNWKSDKYKPAAKKDRFSKKADTSAAMPRARESTESKESIIQVMVKHGSTHQAPNASTGVSVVTKRELLELYDAWRQENQEKLMTGDSNTVDVEVFKGRVGCLMAIRNVAFHPESLLHACFMMTLVKTRLQSKMAIDKFLDTSCLEVLESSHRQYLKRNHSQVKEVHDPSSKCTEEQSCREQPSPAVLSLQKELQSLKLDLTSAQKWRTVKNSQLGAVEEEVDYLETAMNLKKLDKATYFQQELDKLKRDIKVLERHQKEGVECKDLKATEEPLFGDIANDQENYKRKSRIVRNKLTNINLSKTTINTVMDVLARRMSNQLV